MKNTIAKPVPNRSIPVHAGAFVFCERVSGAIRFRVEAAAGGMLPTEKTASLLAMNCLVRGNKPCDYTVLVVPREHLLASVSRQAERLLKAGQAIGNGIPLSRRKREVLELVLGNLTNKEIGVRLNLAERTIKFHIAELLMKFKVPNRMGLMREVALGSIGRAAPSEPLFGFPMPPDAKARAAAEASGRLEVLLAPRGKAATLSRTG